MIVSGSLVLISCFLAGITYRRPSSSMPFDRHAFALVCVLPRIFYLLFRLLFCLFFPLGSPATFFTRERVACLLSIYDCTTLVFDYPYELMPGWNFDSSRLAGDPPGGGLSVC